MSDDNFENALSWANNYPERRKNARSSSSIKIIVAVIFIIFFLLIIWLIIDSLSKRSSDSKSPIDLVNDKKHTVKYVDIDSGQFVPPSEIISGTYEYVK